MRASALPYNWGPVLSSFPGPSSVPLVEPSTLLPPSPPSYQPNLHPADPEGKTSVLHPRVAVLLGVDKCWHFPLLFCRLLSVAPAGWWGLRCALTFMGELIWHEMDTYTAGGQWSVEKRFRVTEVFLAVLWSGMIMSQGRFMLIEMKCFSSAYLAFFFTDCLMSRCNVILTLINLHPTLLIATIVRLLTISSINAYTTSWILYLSGGSEDARLLLPAWICIASTLTILYHLTHPRLAILKETSLSISVFSIASFISMVSLLTQLHLSRTDSVMIPLSQYFKGVWELAKAILKATR
ncbi:N-glycosylation EOS1 protein [Rutstroemia sp. NJR-2017a BVV2]|nr:N-glycosylation EOS1 protein [Rutstroemia sp. NJR-2017a BVV2]PQE19656.1 N-glycosylation EOS1 protein [Rutstroemia sp. NJR-2017a BVV2]